MTEPVTAMMFVELTDMPAREERAFRQECAEAFLRSELPSRLAELISTPFCRFHACDSVRCFLLLTDEEAVELRLLSKRPLKLFGPHFGGGRIYIRDRDRVIDVVRSGYRALPPVR